MKKNFKWMAALAVAVAATSCSNDDLMTGLENNGAQTKGAVGVNTFVPTISRGAALNSVEDLIASENGFDLISFYNQPGDDGTDNYQLFMGTEDGNGAVNDGIEFKHDGSAWDYANRGEIKFWQELEDKNATDMKFFAVSPTLSKWESAGSFSINADEQTITYTVPTDVSKQVDIMYAQKDLADGNYTNTSDAYTNGVPLNFHHALSQIVFKAKIADKEDEDEDGTADYVTAHVNSITVKNVHGAGTFNMAEASSILGEDEYLDGDLDGMGYDYTLWETSDDATNAYEVNTLQNASDITWTEAEELTVGEVDGDETALMLLPQQLTGLDLTAISGGNSANEDQFATLTDEGSYLVVNCRVEYKGNDGTTAIVGSNDATATTDEGYYANLYIPISTQWNPGYKYVYTLIFSADSGDPVKATVESVDEWNEYYEDVPEGSEDNTGDGEEEDEYDGNENNPLLLNYNAADLSIGESVTIAKGIASYGRMTSTSTAFSLLARSSEGESETTSDLTLESDDENIAKVEGNTITAVAAGKVIVKVTDTATEETAEVAINVLPAFVDVTLSSPIKTVSLSAGNYTMGADYEEEYMGSDAQFTHNVTIPDDFLMGQFEVTIGQFVDFLNQNSTVLKIVDYTKYVYNDETEEDDAVAGKAVAYSYTDLTDSEFNVLLCDVDVNHITGSSVGSLSVASEYDGMPVRCSWDGAAAFAKSVGGYLPHEEEWEYAARGGTQGKRYWWCDDEEIGVTGVEEDSWVYLNENESFSDMRSLVEHIYNYETMMSVWVEYAPVYKTDEGGNIIYDEDGNETVVTPGYKEKVETSFSSASEVGNRKCNPWGLYELFGNVMEWCGNYDYNYENGIPDDINHMVRGMVLTMGVDLDANALQISENQGVAYRNCNTDMNETGFRVAFSGTYSGSNSSVQTVSNN